MFVIPVHYPGSGLKIIDFYPDLTLLCVCWAVPLTTITMRRVNVFLQNMEGKENNYLIGKLFRTRSNDILNRKSTVDLIQVAADMYVF